MNIRDFAIGIVETPPDPASSGTTLTLQTGQGSDMPSVPFLATLAPPNIFPTKYNSEKVEVTAIEGDELTFSRAQGETNERNVEAGWIILAGIYTDHFDEALDRSNHTGTQTLSTISDAGSLAGKDVSDMVTGETPSGSVNGSNTSYTTSNGYVSGTLQVWINGLLQKPSDHYSETNPSSGTFSMDEAPESGDNILVAYIEA